MITTSTQTTAYVNPAALKNHIAANQIVIRFSNRLARLTYNIYNTQI